MNWLAWLFEDSYKAEMRKRIGLAFNLESERNLDNTRTVGLGFNQKVGDFLFVHSVYYHIGSKRKYQLLDFSSTVDGLCYIQDIETLEVGRCIKEQLKPIARQR